MVTCKHAGSIERHQLSVELSNFSTYLQHNVLRSLIHRLFQTFMIRTNVKSWMFSTLGLPLLFACGIEGSRSGTLQSGAMASLRISDGPTYDFGSQLVGQSLEHQFTVTNRGTQVANQITSSFYLSQSFSYKGGTYPGAGATCSTELAIDQSCTILIVFSPKSNQSVQAGLTIQYFDGVSHTQSSGNTVKGVGIYSVSD